VVSTNGTEASNLEAVHTAFARWLAFPTDEAGRPRYDLIDIVLAAVIANRMLADPLWIFLVGPPSSGKTEVINSLRDVPDVFPLSSLTRSTFASGFEKKGVETSLLPRITDRIVTLKDFGTVLSLYHEARSEILAQLREIYDGSFSKEWGNGKSLNWTGRIGLVAGVTGVIDREYALGAILGERFLMYRVKGAPARVLARRAIDQASTWQQEQRQNLRAIVAAYLWALEPVPPPMSEPMKGGITALADFTARARSPVFFDRRTGQIDLIPEPEAPGRLAKQFDLLAKALAVVRQTATVTLADYLTIVQVAHDCLPSTRQVVLEQILGTTESLSTTEIAENTGYPTESARRFLQELVAVKLVTRITAGKQGSADRWTASDDLLSLKHDIATLVEPETDPTNNVRGVM
jgi:hypothetical protein